MHKTKVKVEVGTTTKANSRLLLLTETKPFEAKDFKVMVIRAVPERD